ncbi:hypothetical protein DFH09DRAFT_156384 [Mycena vulgaris]|nr:hypothetical protein DFH09DRAFT_156384 [Mycena vulgaris]
MRPSRCVCTADRSGAQLRYNLTLSRLLNTSPPYIGGKWITSRASAQRMSSGASKFLTRKGDMGDGRAAGYCGRTDQSVQNRCIHGHRDRSYTNQLRNKPNCESMFRSTALSGLLGGEVFVAEATDKPPKIVGCAVWFRPGRKLYDSEDQRQLALQPLLALFSELQW